jgi:hypothetical protein
MTDQNHFTTIARQYFTVAALTANNSSFLGNSNFRAIKNYTKVLANSNSTALANTYDAATGVAVAGSVSRRSVGSAFAILALTK